MLNPEEVDKKENEVLTWKTLNDTHHFQTDILSKNLDRFNDIINIWRNRYALFHKIDFFDPATCKKYSVKALEQLEQMVKTQWPDCNR